MKIAELVHAFVRKHGPFEGFGTDGGKDEATAFQGWLPRLDADTADLRISCVLHGLQLVVEKLFQGEAEKLKIISDFRTSFSHSPFTSHAKIKLTEWEKAQALHDQLAVAPGTDRKTGKPTMDQARMTAAERRQKVEDRLESVREQKRIWQTAWRNGDISNEKFCMLIAELTEGLMANRTLMAKAGQTRWTSWWNTFRSILDLEWVIDSFWVALKDEAQVAAEQKEAMKAEREKRPPRAVRT